MTTGPLRILLADDSADMRDLFKGEFSLAIELACQRQVDWTECKTYGEAAAQLSRSGSLFDVAVIDVLWPPSDNPDAQRAEHVDRGFTLMSIASQFGGLFILGLSQGKQPPQDFVGPSRSAGAHAFRYWGDLARKQGSAWTDLAREICAWLASSKTSEAEHLPVASEADTERRTSLPTVSKFEIETVYFLSVDTVSFSARSDSEQISIAQSLLLEVAQAPQIQSLAPGVVVPIFTGDGLIIGILRAANRKVPLDVALALQHKLGSVYAFELRMGVHAGSVSVVTMTDGSRQLLGHAINESVRVMTGAPPNGILVSESYYIDVLHRGREVVPGFSFEAMEVKDKFANTIPCRLVTPA